MSFLNSIFGGSNQKSSSGNYAYPFINQNYGQTGADAFNGGTSALEGLLGLGGGDPQALQKFWNSTGGNFLLNQGVNSINSNMASRGLLNSGADMKALEGYRSGLASSKFNDLIQNFMGLSKLGLSSGDLLAQAGQHSSSSGSSSTGGLGQFLGDAMAMIPFL